MRLDWILSPLTQYGALVLGMAACLGFCLSISARMRAERRNMAQAHESLGETVTVLSTALEQVQRKAAEPEPVYVAPLPGLNLTKRAQVLRMHRRGEPVSTIAAALGIPRNEVELLLKVQAYTDGRPRPDTLPAYGNQK